MARAVSTLSEKGMGMGMEEGVKEDWEERGWHKDVKWINKIVDSLKTSLHCLQVLVRNLKQSLFHNILFQGYFNKKHILTRFLFFITHPLCKRQMYSILSHFIHWDKLLRTTDLEIEGSRWFTQTSLFMSWMRVVIALTISLRPASFCFYFQNSRTKKRSNTHLETSSWQISLIP